MVSIAQVRDDPAVLYPIVWNTKDDRDGYSIADSQVLHDFYLTGVGTYRGHVDDGTTLKAQRAATTIAEVDAAVDTR